MVRSKDHTGFCQKFRLHVRESNDQVRCQFFNLIRTHTIQGTFSDPFYGGNSNFIGWDMIGYPGARTTVAANLQRMDRKPDPSRKSAYDYGMFSKGDI